jgi:hypothetical protein
MWPLRPFAQHQTSLGTFWYLGHRLKQLVAPSHSALCSLSLRELIVSILHLPLISLFYFTFQADGLFTLAPLAPLSCTCMRACMDSPILSIACNSVFTHIVLICLHLNLFWSLDIAFWTFVNIFCTCSHCLLSSTYVLVLIIINICD